MTKLILASNSKDRKEIFERSKLDFIINPPEINENIFKNQIQDPITLVVELAKAKALNVQERMQGNIKGTVIIGADTIVEFNGAIIGKPKDRLEAFNMLNLFSGKTHNLITGIAIAYENDNRIITDFDMTKVNFLPLDQTEIDGYLDTDEWVGRAGAYSLRDKASLFISSIEGSSSNVIGLPMHKVFLLLKKEFNINLLHTKN